MSSDLCKLSALEARILITARELSPMELPGGWERDLSGRLPFTYPFNGTGRPAVSVPCGHASQGQPVGLRIIAGWHQNATALAAAARFEELQPWPLIAGEPA